MSLINIGCLVEILKWYNFMLISIFVHKNVIRKKLRIALFCAIFPTFTHSEPRKPHKVLMFLTLSGFYVLEKMLYTNS